MWAGSAAAFWSLRTIDHEVTTQRPALSIPADTIPDVAPHLRPRHVAVDAAAPSPERQRARCRVKITGQNPHKKLFVAIFDGESGARLGAHAIAAPLPQVVAFDAIPIGHHEIRVARDRRETRRSYLARAPIAVAATPESEVTISATTRPLHVQLAVAEAIPETTAKTSVDPSASITGIPVVLRRRDDPNWRYHLTSTQVIRTDAKGSVTFPDLGPGTYVLSTPGFQPDATERARLVFQRDAFDQTRPLRGRPR